MISGCPGMPKTPELTEKRCPECGQVIEFFSGDSERVCKNCGHVAYNETLKCVMWCKSARECVGDEMYERMMKMLERMKDR